MTQDWMRSVREGGAVRMTWPGLGEEEEDRKSDHTLIPTRQTATESMSDEGHYSLQISFTEIFSCNVGLYCVARILLLYFPHFRNV